MDAKELLAQAVDLKNQGNTKEAQALCREAIKQKPRLDEAHYVLASVHYRDGRHDLAIQRVNTAININPGKAHFFNLLGACYMDRQEFPAAELSLCHALKLRPDYPDPYNNLGLMLIMNKRYGEAEPFLERAIQLQPNDANTMCHIARVYLEREKFAQALQMYDRALELIPGSATPLVGKANALQKLGMVKEALEVMDTIEVVDPLVRRDMLRIKAGLQYNAGYLDEACESMDRALDLMPDCCEFFDTRAHVRKVRRDEVFFHRLQAIEPRFEEFSGAPKTSLSYALGKAYQDIDDIATAAKYYELGGINELQFRAYDEEAESELFAIIKRNMKREYLDTLAIQGSDSERPIFILGMERSGTTLVEQLISTHSAVFPGGEQHYISQVIGGFLLPENIQFAVDPNERLPAGVTFHARAQRYLEKIAALHGSDGHKHITDKMPPNFMNLGLIHALFPKARIIHCRRDPIDNCISSYTSHFTSAAQWSFDLASMGRRYRRYWDLMQHWRRELPGRFLELRYEQVVENTEHYARVLLDWCGLPWEDNVMRFYENDRPVMTASAVQVRQPIYKSSMGRWKKWEPYIGPLLAEISEIEAKYWAELDSKKYG